MGLMTEYHLVPTLLAAPFIFYGIYAKYVIEYLRDSTVKAHWHHEGILSRELPRLSPKERNMYYPRALS